jgi:hypothetical protein
MEVFVNNRSYIFWSGLLVFVFLLAGCKPADPNNETLAWIDAPLDNTHLPLAPYDVVMHGSAPGGVQTLVLRINGKVVNDIELENTGHKLVTGVYDWSPETPGVYLLELRSQDVKGNWSTPAEAVVYIIEEDAAASETSGKVAVGTEMPTLAATETTTPTPCFPMAQFIMNGNCRRGPSVGYAAVTSLDEGASAAVEGRNQDSTWWWILLPESTAHCWVSDIVVETSCLPEDLQWIVAEPLLGTPEHSTDTFYWRSGEPAEVTIRINASGESPITGVSITFHVGDEEWKTLSMNNVGNDVWSITIHGKNDVPGIVDYQDTAFKYYFTAVNQFGLSVQSPTYSDIRLIDYK